MELKATIWREIRAQLSKGRVNGFSAGYDGRAYVLLCLGEEDHGWTTRSVACDWLVLAIGSQEWDMEEVRIPEQLSNFNLVQPIEDGLLLAASRCEYSRPPNPNGRFFGGNGAYLGEVMLGDGVQDMQTTKAGEIWASYFDEDIFGNLGWTNPIGSRGLLRFDRCGQRRFEFHPTGGLQSIVDCYSLNVVNDREAWCCYFTEFPLVRILDDQIVGIWDCPIQGGSTFAVLGDLILMQGAYDRFREWTVMSMLADGQMRMDWTGLCYRDDETKAPLNGFWRASRGSSVWFLEEGIIYHLDLRDLRSRC